MPKHETQNIFYRITWKINTVWCGNKIRPGYVTLQNNFLLKNFLKKVAWKLLPHPFFEFSKEHL